MSSSIATDLMDMTVQRGEDRPSTPETQVAMRLMAAGVPLRLLVDIALPRILVRELFADPEPA